MLDILFHSFVECIILSYYLLVISFGYLIWRILFSKFSDVLPFFTCGSAIGNLWGICLGVTIVRPFPWLTFYLTSHCKKE